MPMKWTAVGAATAMVALAISPAAAHHSVQAVVDTSQRLQAEMVLTKVDWINPHAWFHFTMTAADGRVIKEVPIEWLSLGAMRQAGIEGPEAFKVGQTYQVTYNPNRDGTVGGEIVSLVDQVTGRVFSRGGPGADRPPPPPAQARPPVRAPLTNASY
jgi:hypothetical protein